MASRAAVVLLVPLCATVLSRSRIGAAVQPQPCGAGDLAALRRFSAGLDAAVDGWRLADRRQGANASNNACCSWPRVTCGEAEEGAAAVVGYAARIWIRVLVSDRYGYRDTSFSQKTRYTDTF